MCCCDLSLLKTLENPRDAADCRHRRDIEPPGMSRRMLAKFFANWRKRPPVAGPRTRERKSPVSQYVSRL